MARWLEIIQMSVWPFFKAALLFTMPLAIITFALGIVLGFFVAIVRIYGNKTFSSIAAGYVWLIRGTPLLVQLFLIFYGLPSIGIVLDAFPAAIIGFTISVGAYTSETFRGAITSIGKGQWEAAASIGMSRTQAMRRIILPQAARTATPTLASSFIGLVKDTSLAATITVPELFQKAQEFSATTYEPLILYVEVAFVYLIFCTVLNILQTKLENRLNKHISLSEHKV